MIAGVCRRLSSSVVCNAAHVQRNSPWPHAAGQSCYVPLGRHLVFMRLEARLQPNIGFILRGDLAVFVRSAITPLKVIAMFVYSIDDITRNLQ